MQKPRSKGPRKNHTPRRETQNAHNLKHELFAHEFLVDYDAGAAYKRAGYEVADDTIAQVNGRRLLRNALVWAIVEEGQLKRIEKAGNSAEKTVLRLQLVYEQAMLQNDLAAATAALRELGKHQGIYEKHQRAKHMDADELKRRLEEKGFDFTRVNDRSSN
jgi:phage terminase small subunit